MKAERQARRMLKVYPAAWQREHGEALFGTVLDMAEGSGRDRLTPAETVDLVWQGVSLRVRPVISAAQARLLGMSALIFGGALATASLILGEVAPRYANTVWWVQRDVDQKSWGALPIHTSGPVLYLVWAALLVAALRGRTRLTRQLAVLTVLVALTLPLGHHFFGLPRPPLGILAALSSLAVLVAVVRWRGPDIVKSARAALLLVAVVTAIALPAVLSPGSNETDGFRLYTSFGLSTNRDIPGFGMGELGGRLYLLLVPVVVVIALVAAAVGSTGRANSAVRSKRREVGRSS